MFIGKFGKKKNCGICLFCGFRLRILRIPLKFADFTFFLRIPLTVAESTYSCGIRNKTNVLTKFKSQVFVRGILGNVVNGTQLHFGRYLKTCRWNPGLDRQKIARLSSAHISQIMFFILVITFFLLNKNNHRFRILVFRYRNYFVLFYS